MKKWIKGVIGYAVLVGVPIMCIYATCVQSYEYGLQMGMSINNSVTKEDSSNNIEENEE